MFDSFIKHLRWFEQLNRGSQVIIVLVITCSVLLYIHISSIRTSEKREHEYMISIAKRDSIMHMNEINCAERLQHLSIKNDTLYERIIKENKAQIAELKTIQTYLKQGKWKLK